MKRLRLFRFYGSALMTLLISGAVGWQLRDLPQGSTSKSPLTRAPDLDFFVRPRSFSEIETTRAELEGLALRFRTENRMRQLEINGQNPAQDALRAAAIAELESGIAEFKETPEELYLVQDLLLLLRAQGHYDRWLDVYLEILYRRPTQDLLATFLGTARRLAQETGREDEVTAGFQHLLEIPLDFQAKRLLQEGPSHVALKPTPNSAGPVL